MSGAYGEVVEHNFASCKFIQVKLLGASFQHRGPLDSGEINLDIRRKR